MCLWWDVDDGHSSLSPFSDDDDLVENNGRVFIPTTFT